MDICICIYTHVCEKRLLVPLSSRLTTNDRLDSLVHFPDNGSKMWNFRAKAETSWKRDVNARVS